MNKLNNKLSPLKKQNQEKSTGKGVWNKKKPAKWKSKLEWLEISDTLE